MKKNETKKAREQTHEAAAGFVSVYSNNVLLQVSPWDFKMTFGQMIVATKDKLHVRNDCEVYMSPQHAKAFSALLAKRVDDYERKHGSVQVATGEQLVP